MKKIRLLPIAMIVVFGTAPIVGFAAWQGATATPPNNNTSGPVWAQSGTPGQQTGSFNVSGVGKVGTIGGGTTNGDISLGNDLYFTSSGRSIRVDSNGAAVLNFGNYDGGTGDTLEVNFLRGSSPSEQQVRIIASDTAGAGQICLNGSCISSWPSAGTGDITAVNASTGLSGGGSSGSVSLNLDTSYTDNRYVNVSGDTMTGTLLVDGAPSYGVRITNVNTGMRIENTTGDAIVAFGRGSFTGTAVAVNAVGGTIGVNADGPSRGVVGTTNGSGGFGVVGSHTVGADVGYLGANGFGVYGQNSNGNGGWLGTASEGVYAEHNNGNYGILGGSGNVILGHNEGTIDTDFRFGAHGIILEYSSSNPDLRFGGIGGGGCAGWSGISVDDPSESSSACDSYIVASDGAATDLQALGTDSHLNLLSGNQIRFYVDGAQVGHIGSNGSYVDDNSDIRLKNLHGFYEAGLDELLKLDTYRFSFKEGNPLKLNPDIQHIGVIAQEVEKVIPEAAVKGDEGYYSVDKGPIFWTMINAIKDLKKENDGLSAELEDLRGRMERLEKGE